MKNELYVEKVQNVERVEMVSDFEDLVIYQQSRELAKQIYAVTRQGEFKHDLRFVQQIRAAVGSISDNIAEGFERQGRKEFLQFLYIAKGSCGELRSQVNRAFDVQFIDNETYEVLYSDIKKIAAGIHNMIQKLKTFEHQGSKYNR
ncbi:MAG: four helix bundle protein [Bacteroidales bacterium]|nr:four helix bundle protein [Bacteroidales bacterium]